ncbi:DUF6114 domain-containing protein [Antrihabitans cavernicola]|uniref:DUF6114 domain-containing protein n=1 Tax=Antrihabitans cavernicola TaxID=2495913 RepID=UPI0016599493|nr:DUF6114 domain-containing protein [Spelaeibacter cavernicola]
MGSASDGESTSSGIGQFAQGKGLRARFRRFRWSRPFWGGLFVIFGGLVIGWLPLGPITTIIHTGVGGWAGFACAALLIAMGLFILLAPSQRVLASIVAVVVALASFPLSNLGGFVVGMMAGVIGGSLAFGWTPDKPMSARTKRRLTKGTPPPVPQRPAEVPEVDEDPNLDRGSFTERV